MKILFFVITFLMLTNLAIADETLLACKGLRSHYNKAKDRTTSDPVSFDIIITKTKGIVTKATRDNITFTLEKIDAGTNGEHVYRQLIVGSDMIILRTENPVNLKSGYPLGYQYIIKNTGEYINDFSVFEEKGKCIVPDKIF